MRFYEKLEKINACSEAVEYAKGFSSLQKAWDSCERGDWILWLIGQGVSGPGSNKRKPLVLCACECARLSLKYVNKGEKRPLKAIQTAEKWAKNKGATLEEVRTAAYAAADAADAADAAADAADAAAYAAARTETLKKCADIVRKHYPKAPRI